MKKNKLILGGAQIGNKYGIFSKNSKMKNKKELKKIFKFSIKNNIDYIDTAHDYLNSEKVIGKLSNKNFLIISKINIPKIISNKKLELSVYKKIKISLRRLNRQYIDILLLHNFDQYLNNKFYLLKIFKIFAIIKKRGLIKKIGISTYFPEKVHKNFDVFEFEVVQAPFNIFDQRLLKSKVYKLKKFQQVQIHVRSVFLQGILLKKKNPIYFKKWKKNFDDFLNFTKNQKIDAINFCLKFVSNYKRINKIVVGFQNLEQLQKIFENYNTKSNIEKNLFKNFEIKDYNLILPTKWKI